MYDREVGFSPAEMLDRLARLELDDSDDEFGVGATQVTHRGGHERRQGAREGRQAQAKRCAAHFLDRGIGASERRKHALDVWPQDRTRTRGAEGTLRAVDQPRPRLALKRRELL